MRSNIIKVLHLEKLLVERVIGPAIVKFCRLSRTRLADFSVYCLVVGLILVVPTGLPLVSTSGLLAECLFVILLLGLTVYLALSPSPIRVSPPFRRGFFWLMILRNSLTVMDREFRPYSLAMWSFLLLSEYACLINAYDKDMPRR